MKIHTQPREVLASELTESYTAGHGANPWQAPLPSTLAVALVGGSGLILEKALLKHPHGLAQQSGSESQSRGHVRAGGSPELLLAKLSLNFVFTLTQKGSIKGRS